MLFRFPKLLSLSLLALLALLTIEIFFRLAGFGSFPIYTLDSDMKYVPAANQSGVFMNRNHWQFNDRHMGNRSSWDPEKHPDILLVGNSVVLGGNPYDQNDKVGPALERALGGVYTVWSVAAGAWSNINELAYLEKNADVVRNADFVVIEYMYGGLSQPGQWPGELVFPDRRPLILSAFLFQKYLLPYLKGKASVNEFGVLPPVGNPDPAQIERFRRFVETAAKTSRVLIFLYPSKGTVPANEQWRQDIAPVVGICKSLSITCVDIAGQENWTDDLYKDAKHPTVEGNRVLAGILAQKILTLAQSK